METRKPLTIYTDGSSSLKDMRGGWAFVASNEDITTEHWGCRAGTVVTNNVMEILAVLNAYRFCLSTDTPARIISDSQYVVNCCNVWIATWRRNGWLTSVGEPVKNRGLVEALGDIIDTHRLDGRAVSISWVKGHVGVTGNERADKLAGYARAKQCRGFRLVK